jgi:pSer/pThr/pTyr-binding forkhead associated (FHA) protein
MPPAILNFESSDGTLLSASGVPCLIGRSPSCSIHISSPEVSRRHAVILRDGRDWWLVDCGSRGGTWLNHSRIANAAKLVCGDFIGIGLASLKFLPDRDPGGSVSRMEPSLETTRPADAEWLVTSDTAVVCLDEQGGILSLTPSARIWLHTFFDGPGDRLPSCLIQWLQGRSSARVPYERRIGDERLRVHACEDSQAGKMLMLCRLNPAFGVEALKRIGLSHAETKIVPWLIRGKRNEEMAIIVGIARKTVEKQVASILAKLGVETRTAAAWSIIELTGAHC